MQSEAFDAATTPAVTAALVVWIAHLLRVAPAPPAGRLTFSQLAGQVESRVAWIRPVFQRGAPVVRVLGRFVPAPIAEVGAALALALLLACLAGFIALAEDLLEGEAHPLDTVLPGWLAANEIPGAVRLAEWISEATKPSGVALAAMGVLGALVALHRRVEAWALAATVAGTGFLTFLLKASFGRERPAGALTYDPYGLSFPSGHASLTASLALFIAWAATRDRGPRDRIAATAVVVAVTGGVSAARVVLDVHWVSDVLAGAALGVGWTTAVILVAHWRLRAVTAGKSVGSPVRTIK